MKYVLERKNYGELYHFSSLINIYNIIKQDKLEGGEAWFSNKNPKYKDYNVISLTRSKNFGDLRPEFSQSHIVLDGEKISDNYKIVPHDFFYFYHNPKKHNKSKDVFEFEETILLKKVNYIKPNRYIIDVHTGTFEEFYEHYREYVEQVDFDTQIKRVINIAKDLDIENIPTIDELYENDSIHKEFLEKVYNAIVSFIEEKFN